MTRIGNSLVNEQNIDHATYEDGTLYIWYKRRDECLEASPATEQDLDRLRMNYKCLT